jgi:hypothetical protein
MVNFLKDVPEPLLYSDILLQKKITKWMLNSVYKNNIAKPYRLHFTDFWIIFLKSVHSLGLCPDTSRHKDRCLIREDLKVNAQIHRTRRESHCPTDHNNLSVMFCALLRRILNYEKVAQSCMYFSVAELNIKISQWCKQRNHFIKS